MLKTTPLVRKFLTYNDCTVDLKRNTKCESCYGLDGPSLYSLTQPPPVPSPTFSQRRSEDGVALVQLCSRRSLALAYKVPCTYTVLVHLLNFRPIRRDSSTHTRRMRSNTQGWGGQRGVHLAVSRRLLPQIHPHEECKNII